NSYFSFFFFSSRRRHTRFSRDWSSDVCSSDLGFVRLEFRAARWANHHLPARHAFTDVVVGIAFQIQLQTARIPHTKTLAGNTGEDRKSTRLNSSHVKISYAVFCLKKKNNLTHH